MNMSPEQVQIVRTVINEFLPVAANLACAEKILGIVLKYVEGNANQATARCEVRNALIEANQQAEDERLNLCIETASNLAHGYFRWMQGQDNADALDIYPALELSNLYHHAEAVDWVQKWRENGGRIFPRDEMIALRNDPVWTRISAFHLPFPPFDLDSGMDVDAVPRNEAAQLGLIFPNEQVEPSVVDLDFGEALRSRVEYYFGAEGRRQRFEKEVDQADIKALLQMADERMADEDNDTEAVRDVIFILEHAIERGFRGNWEDQAKAYGLLSEAHEQAHQTEQANSCRAKQLETFEAWVAGGIPLDGNQRATVCNQVAEVYDQIGQREEATRYRQMANESRTGYSLFFEARQRVQSAGGMNAGIATEVIPILEQAMKRGFNNSLQDEVNADALLVAAHDALQDTGKANHYRSQQLTILEAWIAKGIPTESDRRAKAYGEAAEICEKLDQMEKAAAFRQLEDEHRDGLTLLSEALAELKACGKEIDKESGAKILDKLTKSAQRIPESFSERHAEIYRATGRILDAWSDTTKAIEYYEYALEKNPKIAVKGRLDILRKRANKAAAGGGSREKL